MEVIGHFKAVKYIQGGAALFIAAFSVIGALIGEIYGILAAKLLTSILLCVVEISYVRKKILQSSVLSFVKIALPTFTVSMILANLEFCYLYNKSINMFEFILCGILLMLLNTLVLFGMNFIFNKTLLNRCTSRFRNIIKLKTHRN